MISMIQKRSKLDLIGVVMASRGGRLLSNVVKPLQGRSRWFNHSSEKLQVNLYEH